MRRQTLWLAVGILGVSIAAPVQAASPELTDAQKRKLDENFQLCLRKVKGPYSPNYCVCRNGEKKPVWVDGRIVSPCGGRARFCSAFRERWAGYAWVALRAAARVALWGWPGDVPFGP